VLKEKEALDEKQEEQTGYNTTGKGKETPIEFQSQPDTET